MLAIDLVTVLFTAAVILLVYFDVFIEGSTICELGSTCSGEL